MTVCSVRALVLLGALAFAFAGCGIKGPPRPPQAAPTPSEAPPELPPPPPADEPGTLLPGGESPLEQADGPDADGGRPDLRAP